MNKLDVFNKKQIKDRPALKSGQTVRVHQKVKEGEKFRTQVFEGLIIAIKHGRGINATITVRKVSHGVGVERIFPLHSPVIEKIEVIKQGKTRRAKLYYIRRKSAKEARLKDVSHKLELKKKKAAPKVNEQKTEKS